MHVGMHTQLLSCVQFFTTPWTITHQTPLTMEFFRQEYGRGLPFPPPGYLPDSWIESASPVSPALASRYYTTMPPGKPPVIIMVLSKSLRCACIWVFLESLPTLMLGFVMWVVLTHWDISQHDTSRGLKKHISNGGCPSLLSFWSSLTYVELRLVTWRQRTGTICQSPVWGHFRLPTLSLLPGNLLILP